MLNILMHFLFIIYSLYLIYRMCKIYVSSDSFIERVSYLIILLIIVIPLILCLFDAYNISNKINWFKNVNIDRWFNFFCAIFSSLISTIISSLILIYITVKQIKIEKNNNLFDKRIQNAPLFKYCIPNYKIYGSRKILVENKVENKNLIPYSIFLGIENLGLNVAKKIKFELIIDDVIFGEYMLDDYQSILKVNENKSLEFVFYLKHDEDLSKNYKNIKFNVIYSDVLQNKYKQSIELKAFATLVTGRNSFSYDLELSDIKVFDEEIIN